MACIFAVANDLKAQWSKGVRDPLLASRVLALLLEDRSVRTRLAFESAMIQLGGRSIVLGSETGFRTRETPADFCRVLSQFVDIVVVRAARHGAVLQVARHCTCPVINGGSDRAFLCQALADLFTLHEALGPLDGKTLVFLGQRGPLARSLAEGCARTGMHFIMAAAPASQLEPEFVSNLRSAFPCSAIEMTAEAEDAVRRASAVYDGGWTSARQGAGGRPVSGTSPSYRLTAKLLLHAPRDVFRMHNLRMDRRLAVPGELFDHPQSLISAQLANRLHVVKGLLVWLLGTQLAPVQTSAQLQSDESPQLRVRGR
ncbi:MAG: ornithine carbamoyltransferase [Planctomycetes bacterium]|nr:ornithine carbamoyltransferase [Planctomycetota bacterium]